MLSISKKKLRQGLFVSLALVFYYVLLYFSKSSTTCFFKLTTGIPCPACGMSRAVFALSKGDFQLGWHWHPLVYLLPLILVLLIVKAVSNSTLAATLWRKIWLALAVIFIGTWILRMLFYFPDTAPLDYYWSSMWGKILKWISRIF